MSIGAWIFLSVLVFVLAPIVCAGIVFVYLWYRTKKLLQMIGEEFPDSKKE